MSHEDPQALDRLFAAYLDGSIADDQYTVLTRLLHDRPELLGRVAELAQLDRMLADELSHTDRVELVMVQPGDVLPGAQPSSDDSGAVLAQLAAMEAQAGEVQPVDLTDELSRRELAAKERSRRAQRAAERRRQHAGTDQRNPMVISKAWVWLSLAAVLGLVAWLGWPRASGPDTTGAGPVAQTPGAETPLQLADWIDGFQPEWDARLRPGHHGFVAGRYRLTGGQARLRLIDGTQIKLVGPVEFELGEYGEIDLFSGRLVADVPHAATGFCVHTPAGDIVDVGTTFGVDVMDAVTTEAEVIDGLIRVAAKTAEGGMTEFVDVTDDRAARLDKATGRVEAIQAGGDRFSMDYVRVIDLVDAVAGGDGTTGRRNAGIDPLTGDWRDSPFSDDVPWHRSGDHLFHAVGRCPLVAGTFIPTGDGRSNTLDPAGNTFNRFTVTHSSAYGQTWAGGYVPVPGEQPELDTIIDGVNYAAPSRGLVRMHANAGLCFDLAEVRRRNPGLTTTRFRTGLSNREATRRGPTDPNGQVHASVDVWVFVDGELRYSRSDVSTADGMLDIDFSLENTDQYLTIVITDGLNDTLFDWVLLCQPRIDLRPSDRP